MESLCSSILSRVFAICSEGFISTAFLVIVGISLCDYDVVVFLESLIFLIGTILFFAERIGVVRESTRSGEDPRLFRVIDLAWVWLKPSRMFFWELTVARAKLGTLGFIFLGLSLALEVLGLVDAAWVREKSRFWDVVFRELCVLEELAGAGDESWVNGATGSGFSSIW